ncbi:MAG TPA: protein kinase [Thermoanaerobaculia bacterium]|nr:protein kinase [Thermoanaerobaculia bacterium]
MDVRETGSVLDGKYEIVDRLGSGGMGEVYLVRHLHLQELRVVKILRQDLAADPSAQKRFMREARLATQIKHPNVAILYDFSRLEDGSFYMVWEHIKGEEVGDRVRRLGPFPVAVSVQLGIQALRGLEAIHAAGIIHRDLSPDNLMIMEDKRGQPALKIIDLGLARTLETDSSFEITQVGMFMGKLQYCSPEQAGAGGNQPLDARSDLYSFGLVLYEMITGMAPFESESQAGFIFKRLSEDPLPLTGRNQYVDVPAELDRVVRRALERDRDKRYPDAAAFIQALERVLQRMSAAETREIPALSLPPEAAPPPAKAPARVPSRELSRAEKDDLLAQIERAARRVQESTSEVGRLDQLLTAGNLEEAERLVAQIETVNPRTAGLDRAKARLLEMQETAALQRRINETEQVLSQYLQRKQLPLARLALETLTELAPSHPKRSDYQGWIEMLGKEVEQDKLAAAALAAGRTALARHDFAAARRELENAARNDPSGKRSGAFADEIEKAEREANQEAEVGRRMRDLEKAMAQQRLADADRLLDELSRFDVPRITLDSYRERVQESRDADQLQEKVKGIEWLYRKHIQEKDWFRAREAAADLERAAPSNPRASQMFAEIERLEAGHRREQSVEQGVRQVEAFIEKGDAPKAELALKILVQMDPDNRHRKRLEKQVKALPR